MLNQGSEFGVTVAEKAYRAAAVASCTHTADGDAAATPQLQVETGGTMCCDVLSTARQLCWLRVHESIQA